MPQRPVPSSPRDSLADRLVGYTLATWVGLFVLIAGKIAWSYPFGHRFDELAHYSFARDLWHAPKLFPNYGQYHILAADRVTVSDMPNYLSHPPLYYVLIGPLVDLFPGDVRPIRILDIVFALAGLGLAFVAGRHHFRAPAERLVFGILVFGLPVTNGIAGLINNDDLMLGEIGLLIFLVLHERAPPVAIAATLAALGWTKFTGFVAAAIFVVLLRASPLLRGDDRIGTRDLWLIAGLALGALPALSNLLAHGHMVWTPPSFPYWFDFVRPETLATATPLEFAAWFFDTIGWRFAFRGYVLDLTPGLVLLAGLALCAALPRRDRAPATNDLARAALITFAVFTLLHVVYAWHSMRTTGSLVEAQPRYYMPVWPLLAIAVTHGIGHLGRLAPVARGAVLALILLASGPLAPVMLTLGDAGPPSTDDRFIRPNRDAPEQLPPEPPATTRPMP